MPKQEKGVFSKLEDDLGSEDLINLYVNGFGIFVTNADVGVLFKRNNKPVGVINFSYTLAKTLAEKLSNAVRKFEKDVGTEIMTTRIVDEKLTKVRNAKKKQ